MKIYQVITIYGKDAKVKEGMYSDENKAHRHLMSIDGTTCTQRLNEENDENGHYIIKRKTNRYFKAQRCVVYIKPVEVM